MIADTNTMGATQIIPAYNAKSEKENPPRETRPVEDASESQDSKLDVDGEAKDQATEPGTYDAAGNLSGSTTAGSLSGEQGKRIDLII